MTPSEVLTAAADYLDAHGWIQGMSFAAYGGACAAGAIHRVVGNGKCLTDATRPPYTAAIEALQPYTDDGVVTWNDRRGQTKANVVATMRLAAQLSAAEEMAKGAT